MQQLYNFGFFLVKVKVGHFNKNLFFFIGCTKRQIFSCVKKTKFFYDIVIRNLHIFLNVQKICKDVISINSLFCLILLFNST